MQKRSAIVSQPVASAQKTAAPSITRALVSRKRISRSACCAPRRELWIVMGTPGAVDFGNSENPEKVRKPWNRFEWWFLEKISARVSWSSMESKLTRNQVSNKLKRDPAVDSRWNCSKKLSAREKIIDHSEYFCCNFSRILYGVKTLHAQLRFYF